MSEDAGETTSVVAPPTRTFAPWVFVSTLYRRLTTRRNSLVGRLIRLAAAWFIISLVITAVILTAAFHEAALRRFQVGVGQMADNLYADTHFGDDGSLITPVFSDTRTNRVFSGLYWEIGELDAQGRVTPAANSRSLYAGSLALPAQTLKDARAQIGEAVYYNGVGPNKEPLRIAVIYSLINARPFVFLAGEDRGPMEKDVQSFALLTAGALAVLALGSLLAIYFQVRVGLRPLFDLTDEIAHVRTGQQQRLVKVYPAEITPVARQLNAFLDYAQEVVERQRMHVGNLAHALKTPLSVLMATAGDAEGVLPETMRKQAETMRAQVDHHLRRARAAARSNAMGERTPVEPVLDELAVMLEQVFQDKGVIIDWRAPDDLNFRGERQDLQEIAGNLLENACIWCKKKVRILATFEPSGQSLMLSIEDDGPGLDAARFAEVLKRGARLDESVPGSGLGLSIVDELVRAYGGHLSFDRATLRVIAQLPGNLGAETSSPG